MPHDLDAAAEIIHARAGLEPIESAFLTGAGLGESIETLEDEVSIPYADLPGFPTFSTFGQENRLIIGYLEGVRIACLKGRSHYFETGDQSSMALPLEVMTLLGASNLIVTSTCGSVDADFFPGSLVALLDHINLTAVNPLIGLKNDGGVISLTKTYDERLNSRLKRAAAGAGITLKEGVMMWFSGPTFETPAEVRMARTLGATLVGHSGVAEMILARRLGLRACSVSAISHFGAGFHKSDPSYIETREVARQASISLRRLLRAFLRTKDGGFAAEAPRPSLRRQTPG